MTPTHHSPTLQQLAPRLHPAYCWAPDIRERIVQFSFQLCRTNDPAVHGLLASQLRTLLHSLSHALLHPSVDIQRQTLHCLSVLYRLIGFTRDTQFGKGECDLTYLMICEWYAVHPPLACAALQSLVHTSADTKHHRLPYGSWKDMKRFCLYAHRQYQYDAHHPLILYACALLNQQLRLDHSGTCGAPSLVAKWIPREKSPAGKLMYNTLAATYFPWILQTATTCGQQIAALSKCKLLYRQLLSEMNRHLRTVQIFQCAQQWKAIRFPRDVTSATLQKQHRSFLRGLENNNKDRTACREHFLQFLAKVEKQSPFLSGANALSLLDLENEALRLLNQKKEIQDHAAEVKLLNYQWQQYVQQHPLSPYTRRYLIPLLDASASVLQQVAPRIPAIALSLYVAEQSAFGKRVLCFSSTPQWIALDGLSFLEMFAKVHGQTKGCATHSNLHAATQLLCNTMHTASLTPEDVQDLTLVLLSDMQVELPETREKQSPEKQLPLIEALRKQFRRNGWPMPRIWCWNVSNSAGFPARFHEGNVTMLSGWQPRGQLQYLCGAHSATQHHGVRCSPWTILQQQLNHPRYHLLQELCAQAFYNLHPDIFQHGLVVR